MVSRSDLKLLLLSYKVEFSPINDFFKPVTVKIIKTLDQGAALYIRPPVSFRQ